jgi:hypothetical protein
VRRYGYELLSHTHKLYGLCRGCQRTAPKRLRSPIPPPLHVEEIVA